LQLQLCSHAGDIAVDITKLHILYQVEGDPACDTSKYATPPP